MAAEFSIATLTPVVAVRKLTLRVSVGGVCLAKRSTAGLIGLELRRGDGGDPEAYTYSVAYKLFGPYGIGEEHRIELSEIDIAVPSDDPRTYEMRVIAVGGGADISVRDANVATSPYSQPGLVPA